MDNIRKMSYALLICLKYQ